LGLELGYEGFSHEQEYEDGFGGTEDVTVTGVVHVLPLYLQ
jgi:hypothetical protein